MDDEDGIIIASLGLLLTQVRSARRALEEVERNTSRYLGFEFARAFSEGPRFGRPPLFRGALRVHIVNINDLAPGNTFGDFLQGVLGGIGNFIGGMVGGVISGTLSVFALPRMIAQMETISENVRRILDRLGINRSNRENGNNNETNPNTNSTPQAQTQSGETLLTTVQGIGRLVRNLTALFQAASGRSGANRAGQTNPQVLSPAGERWMAIVHGINRVLDRTQHIIDGLIILIPMAIGAVALLIGNLANIRRAILETIQFVLRNVLVLRGVILTTIFETVSAAARLAASIIATLGSTIQSVLGSITNVISTIITAAFNALTTLTLSLQSMIRTLLTWLVDGLFNTLRAIGDLSIFRTVDHFVRILPGVLEPIYRIVVSFQTQQTAGFPQEMSERLNRAFNAGFSSPSANTSSGASSNGAITNTGTSATTEQVIGEFPSIEAPLQQLSATFSSAISATGAHLQLATRNTFNSVGGTLRQLAGGFDRAIAQEVNFSQGVLNRHHNTLTQRANALANTITPPVDAQDQPTGFEGIASAYEDWLTRGNGLNQILNLATSHFENAPVSGEPGGSLGLLRGNFDRPQASVEIDRVEIVLEEPENGTGSGATLSTPSPDAVSSAPMSDEEIWIAWHRHNYDLEERAVRPVDSRTLIA